MTLMPCPPIASPNSIDVSFIGICTHLWEQPNIQPNPAWGTRIVIPNASNEATYGPINTNFNLNPPIEAHVATLAIPVQYLSFTEGPKVFLPWLGNEGLVAFTFLDGVTVTVGNPNSTELGKDARCMPGLGSFVSGIEPGPAATSNDAAQAAGYFDFQTGCVLGTSYGVDRNFAAGILYSTGTSSAAQLVITPFDSSLEPTTVHLTEGNVTAYILNIPLLGDKDNDNDFLLHYLVASEFPSPSTWAGVDLGPPCMENPHIDEIKRLFQQLDFGVGCSNSNLP